MSFTSYKKNRTDLTSLSKQVDALTEGRKSFADERFWRATVNKEGNGNATIRFLPTVDGEDLPWQQYFEHNFNMDGAYFVHHCPTTKGRDCPVNY